MRRIVVDGNYIASRAFDKLGHLCIEANGQKTFTGVPFGVFRDIIASADKFKADSVAFVWRLEADWNYWPKFAQDLFSGMDQPNSDERQALSNSPLGKRVLALETYRPIGAPVNKEKLDQTKILQDKILPAMGINQFCAPGWEETDLIFSYVFDHKDDEVLIYSENARLHYLLNDKVSMIRSSNVKDMTTAFSLKKDYNLPSLVFLTDAYSIAGYPEDGIPGVPGVNISTAINVLRIAGPKVADIISQSGYEQMPDDIKAIFDKTPDWKEIVIRNSKVLTNFWLRGMYGYADITSKYDEKAVLELLNQYQFKSLIAGADRWKEILSTLFSKVSLEAVSAASSNIKAALDATTKN